MAHWRENPARPSKPQREKRLNTLNRIPFLFLISSALVACGGGGGGGLGLPTPTPDPPAPAPSALMMAVEDDASFVDAFRRSLAPALTGGGIDSESTPGLSAPPSLGQDSSGFTTTYRLEANVDEHDFVKYDGEHLFVAPTRGAECCFLLEPLSADDALLPPPPPADGPRRIRIMETNPSAASASEVGAIELEEGFSVEGLYIQGQTVAAIASSAWWGQHGDAFSSMFAWRAQSVGLRLYDVDDPSSPTQSYSLELDGALVTSRRIGDTVLLVTRHFPEIPELNYLPVNDEERATNQSILDSLTAEDLIPQLRINGEINNALGPQDCLIMDRDNDLAPEETGYPVLTTILSVDIRNGELTDTLCYAEAADGVYVSTNTLYLAQTVIDDPFDVDSIVHRIDLEDGLRYRGSGRIAGSLVNRQQPDFRMSEVDDVLRVVTTRWTADEADAFDHRLYTLALAPDAPELEILAQLPEADSGEVIGKPNEDLFGVRFIGDRAYLVTFERIDPLYVIDLADPRAPEILGTLEVPGFSDLLHPVSNELLLGLGGDGEGRIKLELFDVDDPAQPRSQGVLILAEDASWSYSDARFDRRAFTYLATDGATDRFTVPVSVAIDAEAGYRNEERLYMLEIQDKTSPQSSRLRELGFLSATPNNYVETRPRAVIDGDAVFFVLGNQVWSGFWGLGDSTLGPF